MKDKKMGILVASLITLSGIVILGLFYTKSKQKLSSKDKNLKNTLIMRNEGKLVIDKMINLQTLAGHLEGEESQKMIIRIKVFAKSTILKITDESCRRSFSEKYCHPVDHYRNFDRQRKVFLFLHFSTSLI